MLALNGTQTAGEASNLAKNLVSAEGIESARERGYKDIERSRWHVLRCFRCNATRVARQQQGSHSRSHQHPLGLCNVVRRHTHTTQSNGTCHSHGCDETE